MRNGPHAYTVVSPLLTRPSNGSISYIQPNTTRHDSVIIPAATAPSYTVICSDASRPRTALITQPITSRAPIIISR